MDSYQAIYDAVRSRIGGADIGSAVAEAARQAFDISYTLPVISQEIQLAAEYVRQAGAEMQRPCVLFRPTVSIDGNKWCALYGPNLAEGVCGFGDSPAEAMSDFDKNWNDKAYLEPRRAALNLKEQPDTASVQRQREAK